MQSDLHAGTSTVGTAVYTAVDHSDGAGERGGELGAKGVARVVSDRLPVKRQPLRAG